MHSPRPLILSFVAALVCAPGGALFAQGAPATPVAPAAPAAPAASSYDFGDRTSATLVGKAWQALTAKNADAVLAYTGYCRELYQATALQQQAALTAPPPTNEPEKVHANWALNDVGTALFLQGQVFEEKGSTADAVAVYKLLVEKLSYAQCWDAKGWFWSPADAAKGRLRAIEFEQAGM